VRLIVQEAFLDPSINAANLATPSASLSPWALFVHGHRTVMRLLQFVNS